MGRMRSGLDRVAAKGRASVSSGGCSTVAGVAGGLVLAGLPRKQQSPLLLCQPRYRGVQLA